MIFKREFINLWAYIVSNEKPLANLSAEVKNKLIDFFYIVFATFGVLLSLVSLLRLSYTGFKWVYLFYLLFASSFIYINVFREKINFNTKFYFAVVALYVSVLFGMLSYGLFASINYFLVLIPLLFWIFKGIKPAFYSGLSTILLFVFCFVLLHYQVVKLSVVPSFYITEYQPWLITLIVILAVTTFVLIVFSALLVEKNEAQHKVATLAGQLDKVFDVSPVGMALFGFDNKVYKYNNKFTQLFGYTLADIPTVDLWFPIAYPDKTYCLEVQSLWGYHVQQYFEKGTPVVPIETMVTCKDGSIKYIEFGFEAIGDVCITSFVDQTQHKLEEKALKEHQLLVKRITEQSPDLIYIFDLKLFKNVFINKNLREMLGYKSGEAPHDSFEFIEKHIHPDDMKQFNDYVNMVQSWQFDYVKSYEYRLQDAQGDWRCFMGKEKAFQEEDGNVISLIGVVTDITERKNVETRIHNQLNQLVKERTDELLAMYEELVSMNEDLALQKEELQQTLDKLHSTQDQLIHSEKMASLGVLVAGVAHEINNPVNFISSSVIGLRNNMCFIEEFVKLSNQLVNRNTVEDTNQLVTKIKNLDIEQVLIMYNQANDHIQIGVDRVTAIIKGLSTFARTDEKTVQEYNIQENIENTLLILYNQYKHKIEIIRNFGDVPDIECYPSQINQVVMNILANAIQSINDKGTITISTQVTQSNEVMISIKDTGVGMSESVVQKVFDPFFTTKEVGQGTGLGLYISFGLVMDHKGRLEVESMQGKGTEFRIILPLKQKI